MGKKKQLVSDEESEEKQTKKIKKTQKIKKDDSSSEEPKMKQTKKTSIKEKPQQKNNGVKQEEEEDDMMLNVQFLPGQKYKTPIEGDGTRLFYESLYEQNPQSKMAEKWCLENGVLNQNQAEKIIKSQKLQNKK